MSLLNRHALAVGEFDALGAGGNGEPRTQQCKDIGSLNLFIYLREGLREAGVGG